MDKFLNRFCWFFVILLITAGHAAAVEVGAKAPGFSLTSVQEKSVALADFAGKIVLLKIGTTWCPGCTALGAEIDALVPFLDEREVAVLDVFVQDSVPMVEELLEGKKLYSRYSALMDDGSVYREYSVYLIPRLLVVDENQLVRFDSAGRGVAAEEIRSLIEDLKAEKGDG